MRAAGLHVVKHRVAVAERSALHVLAGQADAGAVGENRRDRELFGRRPVHRALVGILEDARALLPPALELLVDGEVRGQGEQRLVELAQPFERDGRVRLRGRARRRRLGLRLHEIALGAERLVRGLHLAHSRLERFLGALRVNHAPLRERPRPDLARRGMVGDSLVHQRLRERRLVAFVVPVAPVSDQIDQEVALEALAIGERQPRRLDAGFRIVGVDVHDRDLEPARETARVRRAVNVLGTGGEPELVVDDDVNRAAGRIPRQPAQVQRLRDDALPWKRRVPMNQDRHAARRIEPRRTAAVHARARRARHPLDDRIDRFEVARVRRHRDDEIHRRAALDRAVGAGVVLDVARPRHVLAEVPRDRILELGEDLRVRLVQHVGHHVEPAPVRHPDENLVDARFARLGDHLVEDGHEHVEAFDREARLAWERALQEALERFDLRQAIEQLDRIDRIRRRAEAAALGGLPEPLALVRHEHVRVVVARLRAVDSPQRLDGIVRRRHVLERSCDETRRQALQIVAGDSVSLGEKRRIADGRLAAQRIEPRREMSVSPNGFGEVDRADDLVEGGGGCWRRRAGRSVVLGGRRPALEERAGLGIDGGWILAVLLVQFENVSPVKS